MNNVARLHPNMSPDEELAVLLKQLPPSMGVLVKKINDSVKTMSPAWLQAFVAILWEKVAGVLAGENKVERAIEAILNNIRITPKKVKAANDEYYGNEWRKRA